MSNVSDTLADRERRYGKFSVGARITEDLLEIFEAAFNWQAMSVGQRLALRMIAVKLSRALNGDAGNPDSWHDIAGYATLGERECDTQT